MIGKDLKYIKFSNFYKKFNIFSFVLVALSISTLFIKGLNLGVDFKGGTLIEVRVENTNIGISEIRQSLLKMDLEDVTVKKFGKESDYLVKTKIKKGSDESFIQTIKDSMSSDLGTSINFRRVENVGPKVSKELLKDGMLAISL